MSTSKGRFHDRWHHVVEARIGLASASAGGIREPMPSGARSLLLKFASLENAEREITIGAVLDTVDRTALEPGSSDVVVHAWFWADAAQVYATPGARFLLWYAGRIVGQGQVLRVIDEVADSMSR